MHRPIRKHAVTGAFGYSGSYIASRLLDQEYEVITLTNSPGRRNALQDRVKAFPLCFDDPARLTEVLQDVQVLYNTYWVRFNHRDFGHEEAVENTKVLFAAAKDAGVSRVVHVSITNPSLDSPFEYFRGKAELEQSLVESGLGYAILRPAVLFGGEDILINNIAWMLRRFPLFGMFGDGSYRLQPIHVDDLAQVAVEAGLGVENVIIDAIGPETFTYRELVRVIGEAIGRTPPVFSMPPGLGYVFASILGRLLGDVVVTREEIGGLMADLLCVDAPPAGETRLSDWASRHADTLGIHYAHELVRRRDRSRAYADR